MSQLIYPSALQNGTENDAGQVNELFDAVVAIVNGNLDASNLKTFSALIATSSFQQDAGIVTGCFKDLSVDQDSCQQGFAINSRVQVSVPAGLSFSTTPTTVVQFLGVPVVGPRPVRILGSWALTVRNLVGTVGHVTFSWYRSDDPVHPVLVVAVPVSYAALVKTMLPMVPLVDTPPPGTFSYSLVVQTDQANLVVDTPGANAGLCWLEQAT